MPVTVAATPGWAPWTDPMGAIVVAMTLGSIPPSSSSRLSTIGQL